MMYHDIEEIFYTVTNTYCKRDDTVPGLAQRLSLPLPVVRECNKNGRFRYTIRRDKGNGNYLVKPFVRFTVDDFPKTAKFLQKLK